jgi:cytochrome c-type biogenesis protein CcmH/NrfG
MTPMIWNFVIIGAVVLIFLILVRRLPVAAKFIEKEKEVEKEVEMTPEKLVNYSKMSQADEAFEAKKYNVAEDLYIQIASREPNNAKVYNRLGVIYLDQKNYYDAKDAFLQSIKLDAGDLDMFLGLGHAYMGLKDYFKASQAYLKAIDQEPKNKVYKDLYEKAQKALDKEKKRKK